MRPLIRSLIRTIVRPPPSSCSLLAKSPLRKLSSAAFSLSSPPTASSTICLQCQFHRPFTWKARFYSSNVDKNSRPPPPLIGKEGEQPAGGAPPDPATTTPAPESLPMPPRSPPDQDNLTNLPSQQERRRSEALKRFSEMMDKVQSTMFTAGQKLNVLTGYSDIESLKKSIEALEDYVQDSRQAVRQAKDDYQNAINRRSASQREVNELLQRKHAWGSTDLERFTQLYRSDHTNEQEEVAAQERLALAEQTADEAQAQLARSILARYHEEQIWSDKIRRASTWGTWVLMGFNVLLFVVVQLGLEPWKRKRLVGSFEEKVREVIMEENTKLALLHSSAVAESQAKAVKELEVVPEAAEAELVQELDAGEVGKELVDAAAAEGLAPEKELAEEQEVVAEIEEEAAVPVAENMTQAQLRKEEAKALLRKAEAKAHESIYYVKEKAREFLSEEEVVVSRVDLTKMAVTSAAVGALVTGLIALLINR